MRSLIIITILQLALSLKNFSQEFKICLLTYCQQDQICIDQAYPQLFCALNNCPISSSNTNTLDDWYLCLQKQFQSCKVSNYKANQAALFCFTNYDWNQDQLNTNNYDSYLNIKSKIKIAQSTYQTNLPQYQIQPCYSFPFFFSNCIAQACRGVADCIQQNSSVLQCALSQANTSQDLNSWYNAFLVGFNAQTCKSFDASFYYYYFNDYCFMKYNWRFDCINFQ
ncbi:hypothetical protein ABPG72_013874 [Tetrahymena utriculariae]